MFGIIKINLFILCIAYRVIRKIITSSKAKTIRGILLIIPIINNNIEIIKYNMHLDFK